jgi:hypothetical protein
MKINAHLSEAIDDNFLTEEDIVLINYIINRLIDSGMSEALYNPVTWLEISNGINKDALCVALAYLSKLNK